MAAWKALHQNPDSIGGRLIIRHAGRAGAAGSNRRGKVFFRILTRSGVPEEADNRQPGGI